MVTCFVSRMTAWTSIPLTLQLQGFCSCCSLCLERSPFKIPQWLLSKEQCIREDFADHQYNIALPPQFWAIPLHLVTPDISTYFLFLYILFCCCKNIEHGICPLNKILSLWYSTANCRATVQKISGTCSSCMIEILCQLISNALFPLSPSLWQPTFYSLILWDIYFGYLIQVESCRIFSSVTDLFHLA